MERWTHKCNVTIDPGRNLNSSNTRKLLATTNYQVYLLMLKFKANDLIQLPIRGKKVTKQTSHSQASYWNCIDH